jgi:membrane associated rhomboid family serine protease
MIIPIGHEEAEVRRLPWVTIAIMATCVLMLLATNPKGELSDAPPEQSPLQQAAEYWRDRPYLDAPPEVEIEVSYDVAPNQRKQYLGMLKTNIDPPDAEEVAREQAELDAILAGELAHAESMEPVAPSPYQTWGLTGTDPSTMGFLTHMFMHAGWFHLIGNLFLLFLAGPALEDRWGRPLYAAFYLVAGLASGAFFIAMESTHLPLVGASGAIAGVLGAFLVRYAKTPIRFFYFFFFIRVFTGTFEAPAWAVLPLWFGNELLAASVGVEDGVAYWAHVGGFLFGVATALAIRQLGLEERFDARIEAKISVRGNAAVAAALALRGEGDVEGAYAKLEAEMKKGPDADVAIAYLDTAAALGRVQSAVPGFVRTIKALLPAHKDDAARCWLELGQHAPEVRLDPLALLAIHETLAAQGVEAEAKRALRHAADPKNAALTPSLALRVLDASRGQDAQAAVWAARFVVDSPQVADEKKTKLRAELPGLEAQVAPPEEPAPTGPRRTVPLDVGLDDEADPPAPAAAEHAHDADEPFSLEQGRMLDAGDLGGEAADPDDDEADLPRHVGRALPAPAEEPALADEPELADEELGALLAGPRFADTKVTEATPKGLDDKGVVVALAGGGSGRISFEKIQAVSVAAVGGLGAKPIVLVDLLLNWNAVEEPMLRVVRMRSDRFDPRALASGAASPLEALRAFLRDLLARSGAAALPDVDGARATPLRSYADLATYQREALDVA